MNKPMIENSDRGVTINKSLAWTMAAGLLAGGVWVGSEVTETKQIARNLIERQDDDRELIRENRREISELQSTNARVDQRLINIERSASRTETTVGEILRYLQGVPSP